MEITPRQLERMITCTILLEEACGSGAHRNPVALRAAKLIREQLDDIDAGAGCGEGLEPMEEQPDLPGLSDPSDPSDRSDGSDGSDKSDIAAYGRALLAKGVSLHGLFDGVCRKFGLTQDKLARLLGVNQGSLSKYMRLGQRSQAVTAAAAEFFGDGRD